MSQYLKNLITCNNLIRSKLRKLYEDADKEKDFTKKVFVIAGYAGYAMLAVIVVFAGIMQLSGKPKYDDGYDDGYSHGYGDGNSDRSNER